MDQGMYLKTFPGGGGFFSLKLNGSLNNKHLPSVYSVIYSLIISHNALVSHLKLVPGFRACLKEMKRGDKIRGEKKEKNAPCYPF